MSKIGSLLSGLFLFASMNCCAQKVESKKSEIVEEIKSIDEVAFIVALRFINNYVANANKMNQAVDIRTWINSSRDVTSSFKNALNKIVDDAIKHDPELGLESDPIFDAQDYPDEGFKLIDYNPKNGLVRVEGKKWKDFKLNLRILKIDNVWFVDGAGVVNIPDEMKAQR